MNRQYYMIGITGIGMSSLAQIIRRQGFSVRGSDANPDNKISGILNSSGIDVFPGHQAGRIDKKDTVIYSTAVSKSNPEYIDAEINGCRIIHRSCALKDALGGKKLIAVTGTHGKTTTTYVVSTVLKNAGFDFGMI
ncbi:MAG: Mur ligase domain-containing protein, partial [Candidatus Omnitrophica bacterium]|nr:Mur ligase domain-containing protein [Candidatus Omnitrophota bacterium]